MGTYLSHSCQESLGIEEPGHPERVGTPFKTPGWELSVPVYQLSEPETKGTGIPGDLRRSEGRKRYVSLYHTVANIKFNLCTNIKQKCVLCYTCIKKNITLLKDFQNISRK